jgi:hypothetical protein
MALAAVAAGFVNRKTPRANQFAPAIHQVSAAHITLNHCNKLRATPNVPGKIRTIYAAIAATVAVL